MAVFIQELLLLWDLISSFRSFIELSINSLEMGISYTFRPIGMIKAYLAGLPYTAFFLK